MNKPSEEFKRIYTVALSYIEELDKKRQAYSFNNTAYTKKELKADAEKIYKSGEPNA